MSSFFGRLKQTASPLSPSIGSSPTKRDPNAPQPTPLEKHLADYNGPIRPDGSDKFFGFENFGSTCYCNSIIQCLYYSAPFREQVINFPARSPQDTVQRATAAPPRLNTDIVSVPNGQPTALSPTKSRGIFSTQNSLSPRTRATPTPGLQGGPGNKSEENKESPEYRKKLALAAGPVLNMQYENAKSYGMNESLYTAMKDMFEAVVAHPSRIGVVSPNKFLEVLRRENEMFRTPMHQDAHEFLNLLLNQVLESVEQYSKENANNAESTAQSDNSLASAFSSVLSSTQPDPAVKPSMNNSDWVHELFEGTLTSETRCLTCENTSQRDEAFLDLSVDLEQHSSVTSCLRKFSEEEMLCERNKFHCDNCGGLQEAEKRMKIKRLPRILALHLKRFKYTEDLQRLQKLFHRVVYPYYLRLFNTTDDAEDPDRLYELYAVVIHIGGGPYHGHYVSIIKTQDRGWLLFDDELVEPVDKSYVRNFFGSEKELACAYVLFYQETTFEAMQREQESEGLAAVTQASDIAKEGATTEGKPNGVTSNGAIPVPLTPATPMAEESDMFANLDHAATSPPMHSPLTPHLEQNALEHSLSAVSPSIPTGSQSKKERAREEKERKAAEKAAEKDLEKQMKAKRKEMETKRRENYKRQEDDLGAAIAASKVSKADEDSSRPPRPTEDSAKENGTTSGLMAGSLNRFRHSSMSIRSKTRFWQPKERSEQEMRDAANALGPMTLGVEKSESSGNTPSQTPDKAEKMKNRFSLGRKKSGMLL